MCPQWAGNPLHLPEDCKILKDLNKRRDKANLRPVEVTHEGIVWVDEPKPIDYPKLVEKMTGEIASLQDNYKRLKADVEKLQKDKGKDAEVTATTLGEGTGDEPPKKRQRKGGFFRKSKEAKAQAKAKAAAEAKVQTEAGPSTAKSGSEVAVVTGRKRKERSD